VGSEPFAVLLGDTLVDADRPVTKQLLEVFDKRQASVVGLEEVERSKVSRYGIMGGEAMDANLYRVSQLVEKPSEAEAPSNLAIAGRYVFTPEIFDYIARTERGKNGEIQLTDAMRLMLAERPMFGWRFDGVRYDIGNKLDFLKTNIAFGLKRPDIAEGLQAYIREIAAKPRP
jgi:UTP--glucose-1-phosphate uridylyltransferase